MKLLIFEFYQYDFICVEAIKSNGRKDQNFCQI